MEVASGITVLQAALNHKVEGILGECGGNAMCATCHVYVDPPWIAATGSPDDIEDALLDMVDSRQSNSRLSCQIKLGPELDGLKVTVGPTS